MNLTREQRVVTFEGMSLVVPEDATYLTIDCSGDIVAHGSEPWSEVTFWEWMDELGVVGVVDPEEGADWMNAKSPEFIGHYRGHP